MFLRTVYPTEGVVDSRTVIRTAADVVANSDDVSHISWDGFDLARAIEIVEDAGRFTFTQRTVERHGAYAERTVERV